MSEAMSPDISSDKATRIDIHPDFMTETMLRKERMIGTWHGKAADDPSCDEAKSLTGPREYQNLLESIYDAVLITDLSGVVEDFNWRAAAIFFGGGCDLAGASILKLISGADKGLLDTIRQTQSASRHSLMEAYCVKYDGSLFPAEIAVSRVDLNNEDHLCFFIRDITRSRKAQEALEDAVTRLERLDQSRLQFVSNVSHELRTPLTSMIYAVGNMLKGVVGPLPDKVKKYLEMLDGDCRRLLNTVNDILDLRHIDNNTLTLIRTPLPFGRLVRRGIDSLAVQAERKGITIKFNNDYTDCFVNCDAQKMDRVLMNILVNAIKFTSSGGEISCSMLKDPDVQGNVQVRIEDNGIGIPKDAVGKVMERYFTVGEQASGSGLGLAISREIVELHSGTMRIVSPGRIYDRGTEVILTVPVADPPMVLIADDEEETAGLMRNQVASGGYRTEIALDGTSAMKKIESMKPDLVLLDLIMPGMDGTEIILKMRQTKELTRIPIIVVTGGHVGAVKTQILSKFSIPALSKPWTEDGLMDTISDAFVGTALLNSKRN